MRIFIFISLLIVSNLSAQNNKNIKVALLMPFCAEEVFKTKNSKNTELSDACISYYQGLLLAADSLKNAGFNLKINVFDTKKDTNYFKKLLQNEIIQNADFIIGPVIKEGQILMQNFRNKKDAFHLSPLFTFTKTKINDEKSIAAYPEMNFYFEYLYSNLKKFEKNGNVVVLVDNDANNKQLAANFKTLIKSDTAFKVSIIDITNKSLMYKVLTLIKTNYMVLLSNDENQLNAAIKSIADTSMYYKTKTFCFKKETSFNTINLEDWLNSNLHLITPFYVNYNQPLSKKFVSSFISQYETEPNEFAFVGYDQLLYFITLYEKTNGNFNTLEGLTPIPLLGSKYKLIQKTGSKGFQNGYLNILKVTETGLEPVY